MLRRAGAELIPPDDLTPSPNIQSLSTIKRRPIISIEADSKLSPLMLVPARPTRQYVASSDSIEMDSGDGSEFKGTLAVTALSKCMSQEARKEREALCWECCRKNEHSCVAIRYGIDVRCRLCRWGT